MEGRRKVGELKLLWMGGVVKHLRKRGNQKRQGESVADEGSTGSWDSLWAIMLLMMMTEGLTLR